MVIVICGACKLYYIIYIIPVAMDFRVILYFVSVFEFLVVLRCEPNRNQGQLFVCTELRIRHFCNDQMSNLFFK